MNVGSRTVGLSVRKERYMERYPTKQQREIKLNCVWLKSMAQYKAQALCAARGLLYDFTTGINSSDI